MEVQKYTGWNKSMTCKPDILFDVLWPNCREADIIDYLTGQSKRWLNLHVYVVVFWDYITLTLLRGNKRVKHSTSQMNLMGLYS